MVETEEDVAAELASWTQPGKWQPTHQGRYYVYKPVTSMVRGGNGWDLFDGYEPQGTRAGSQKEDSGALQMLPTIHLFLSFPTRRRSSATRRYMRPCPLPRRSKWLACGPPSSRWGFDLLPVKHVYMLNPPFGFACLLCM